jgi:uncharacterized protein with HEPN domain
MYKDNGYYLDKMEENVDFIIEHMKDVSKEQLEADPVLQDSMMLRLVQISENAKNLTDEFREQNAHIPWTDIYGLRNRIVHDYGHVDLGIVYDTLTQDIAEIKAFLEQVK